MIRDHIYIQINPTAEIRFDLSDQVKDAFRYDEIEVVLRVEGQSKVVLFDDFLIVGLRELYWPLTQILAGNLILHSSITADIGYLWNEYLHDIELPSETNAEGDVFWVGKKYLVWNGIRSKAATWLYEKDGKFWFEVTPGYQWHFDDPKVGENFESYIEFMKKYKPIALFEVSRDTLEEWFKRVQELIPIVEANDSKYFIKAES